VHVWDVVSATKMFTSPPDGGDPVAARARTQRIVDVVWTGPILATTLTFDGSLANWDVTQRDTLALVSRPPSPNGAIGDVDANVDRGTVAVAGRGGLYAAVPGRVGWTLVEPYSQATNTYPVRVQLNHDASLLASVWSDASVRIYSTATREKIRGFGFGHAPSLLAFSRDGELLAVGGPGPHVSVWKMAPNNDIPIHLTAPGGRPLRAMSFARHGRSLVLLEEGERYLREIEVP
jgi:WD40 repeat protein